jgi:23S rRNA (adenine2503-C2)-methyltransferase
MQNSIYSLQRSQLEDFLLKSGENPSNATSIFENIYKDKDKVTKEISKKSWSLIAQNFSQVLPTISKMQTDTDGTIKFLIEFSDKKRVETVLLPFHKRYTVCLSSQVGCAMNCSFCYTGTQGLSRNLSASEIVAQYLVAFNYLKHEVSPKSITPNIVFMGQGEPLHNLEEINQALHIMFDHHGLHLGPRQVTLSTAGFLPGLKKFHTLPPINLALSLHSAFNEIRSELIPINKQYPLEAIFNILDTIPLLNKQFITYEYLLIDGLNDREVDADELYKILHQRRAIINLIPFNPFPGSAYKRPTLENVNQFKSYLVARKLRTMVRQTKGDDILAACGQLNSKI